MGDVYTGVVVGLSLCVPSIANVFVISFPKMPVWALTLCTYILCGVQYICYMIVVTRSLCGWWCCKDGCLMWLFARNILLMMLSMKMCVSNWVILMVVSMVLSSPLRMFW